VRADSHPLECKSMPANRLEILRNLVTKNPGDSRTRYMLAMELANSGELEAAVAEYRAIIEADASYIPAYFHCGQALAKLGRIDEAREVYRQGIEACDRAGDSHTREEIEDALAALD